MNRYDGSVFETKTTADGLVDNRVYAILEDSSGFLWFATQAGVSRYDGEKFSNFTTADGLVHDDVNGVIEASDGRIWMATDGGVSCYDGASFTNYTFEKNDIPSAHVHGIAQSRDGDIWAATSGGIWRLGGGEYKTYTKADGLPNDQVQRVFEDSMGTSGFPPGAGFAAMTARSSRR